MPGLQNYHIIAPIAGGDRASIVAATVNPANGQSLDPDQPLYNAADPAPRTATHTRMNGGFTTAQETAIETPGTGLRATLPNSDFTQYNRKTQSGTPAARLLALGLTADSGVI